MATWNLSSPYGATCNHATQCGIAQRPIEYSRWGWPPMAILPRAIDNQVGKCMLVIIACLVDKYEYYEEGMTLVIKAQEISFSTINNVH